MAFEFARATGGGLSAAETGRWGAAFALASSLHAAPAPLPEFGPHAGNRCVLIEMRRRMSAGGVDGRRWESVRRDGSWNWYYKTWIHADLH